MITEDYVSFEIAKLLKEKGFDEFTFSNYNENGIFQFNEVETRIAKGYQRPTHQMALKWLREVHKLFIEIVWIGYENMYSFNVTNMKDGFIKEANIACSYNEAVEAALKYTLENLI